MRFKKVLNYQLKNLNQIKNFRLLIDYFISIENNIITAMNKNSRGSFDERMGVRAPHRNNINIQINFNVKDKNQGFVGKKIDNFMQVQQKNPKVELQAKTTEESKKNKKRQNAQKMQKQKYSETPVKYKNFQRTKAGKNYEEKTPQRKSNEKRQQRSKSTNQKLVKRKNAKSMQNIKTGIKYTKNKDHSLNSSPDKSRSNSKSSKKLIRNTEQSLKNLYMFTNSGIKNKLNKQKVSNSRQRQISVVSKKATKQQDQERIKKYIQQKKKKTKIDKTKQLKQQKIKKQKVREQLKRVEAERKANAGKPLPFSKKQLVPKQEKLPIYCFDDQEFDQQNQYQSLNKQASEIIHQSPTPSNVMNSIPINAVKSKKRLENSSSKKLLNAKKDCLVYKYLNKTINSKQFKELQRNIIKIQTVWRGYVSRRQFLKKLNDQATRFRYIKNKIDKKRQTFWNDEQENSIVNVQKDSETIKVYDSGHSSINCINFSSNINSQLLNNQDHVFEDQKQKTDKFKRLSIRIDDDDEAQLEREISKEKSDKQTYENSKMLKEIEQLRKMLEKQTQKYKSLEEENQNLKANIKVLSLKQSREISQQKSEDLINSKDFIQIRMPKKIQSPANANNIQVQKTKIMSNTNQRHQITAQEEKSSSLDSFKKHFQTFQCSSPSNARLQEQLKQLKSKNIQNIFLKKEIKIDQKYAKKREMFDRMLSQKIVSPRTYSMKKKQLQLKLKDEKEQVKKRIDEAKRVVGFIDDIELSQEDIRATHVGQMRDKVKIDPNLKKQKNLQDSYTNTSPLQKKQIIFKNNLVEIKKQKKERSQSEQSSDSQKIYRKYWTDDIQEVHQHTLEITKKIEQAMKAESQESSNKFRESSQGYNSNQYYSAQSNKQSHSQALNSKHQKSKSQQVNLQSLKESYETYLQEVQVVPIEPQKKARQIFNRIDLSEQKECKSEDQLQNSNQNIYNLLNQRPLHTSPNQQKNQINNLYVSEAEFNKKKKFQQDLSRSSSFQKSNKSLSVNNNSQLQYKGFITNLTFIKQFCISMCEFIRNNDHYREFFVQKISQSIKYDKFEYLRAYRVTISGDVKNNYNNFQDEYVYPYFKYISQKKIALSDELFNDFLKAYDQQKAKDLTWNDPSMNRNTKEMRQFFLKSIKDNFNQSLDYQKPGSIYGEPMPWLHNSKYLKNHMNVTLKDLNNLQKRYSSDSSDYEEQNQEEKRLDQIFGSSIAKIIQWGSCLCGFIADPMPMEMGDSQIANLSDQQLNSIRQNRVGLMLEKWLLEEEQLMTNATMEYTEVLLFLGEKIINLLILQCAEEVQEFLQA